MSGIDWAGLLTGVAGVLTGVAAIIRQVRHNQNPAAHGTPPPKP